MGTMQADDAKQKIKKLARKAKDPSREKEKKELNPKSSPQEFTKTTLLVRTAHLDKLKAIAHWDRMFAYEVLDQILTGFLSKKEIPSVPVKKTFMQ